MIPSRILIIEDEPAIAEVLVYNLEREGFKVQSVENGAEGLKMAKQQRPDLVLLDLMLPGKSGLEVCRELRANSGTTTVPIIVLTAKAEEADQVVGFAMGADDYVTKPFSVKILLQRVHALLRRANSPEPDSDVLEHGTLKLDKRSYRVTDGQAELPLTPTEFRLLETLMRQPERAFSRSDLLDYAVVDGLVGERTIDVHVKSLRTKLGEAGRCIVTVRGVGYRFSESE